MTQIANDQGSRTGLEGVVAAIDQRTALPVLLLARRLADRLDRPVSALHVEESAADRQSVEGLASHCGVHLTTLTGDPGQVVASVAAQPEVDVLVLGTRGLGTARSPLGHVTSRLVRAALSAPLVLVPPTEHPADRPLRRVLEPLDADEACAAVTEPMIDRLSRAGCEVVGLHVFEANTVPAFLDHAGHGTASWRHEFARRHGMDDIELRRGPPGRRILQATLSLDIDLVVLGWSCVLDDEHGKVVAQVLSGTDVPVMLVPTRSPIPPQDHP